MKQYTTPEQTAKLIKLGFKPPMWRGARKFDDQSPRIAITSFGKLMTYSYENVFAYSIGELIEMLPDEIYVDENTYSKVIDKTAVCYYSWELEIYAISICDAREELIDNLFDMCVKLKDGGVI